MKIIGISGSLREGSYNTALLNLVASIGADHDMEIVPLHDIPLYNADDQDADGFPQPVQQLGTKIAEADALYIASPEYNYGMSGVLKNTIDWLSRMKPMPFIGLPVALIGGSPGSLGTAYSHANCRQILSMLGARIAPPPNVLVSQVHEKLDNPDEKLKELIRGQLKSLEPLVSIKP